MSINREALKRLRDAEFQSKSFVDTMDHLENLRDTFGSGDVQISFDYQQAGDDVKAGEMIPFIIIGLRQANVENDN